MKKFITVILLSISMFSFFILYTNYKETQIFNMKNAEHHLDNSYSIMIPTKINALPRDEQYDEFLNASTQNNASIFFTRIDQTNNEEKIIKYVLLTNDDYMNSLTFIKGKPLDKSLMGTDYFISTEDTGDPNQIGQIASFDGIKMEIHTLQSLLDDGYFIDGYCTVSIPDGEDINSFVNIFKEAIGADIIEVSEPTDIGTPTKSKYFQIPILFIIFMILIFYEILKSYKRISIQKMLGFSFFHIWRNQISKIFVAEIFTIIISIFTMSLILFKDFNLVYINFFKYLLVNYIYLIITTLISASIPFIYIKRIKIISLIKNKRQVKEIIIFNNIIKVILCIFFIFLINKQLVNYSNITKAFDGTYKRWDTVSNYRVLSLNRLTEDIGYSDNFINSNIDIYSYFNKKGAIFADFNQYTKLSMNMNQNVPETNKFAMVNPNYLIENPIYDSTGKQITISEDDENWILLIPEKYINDESSIRDYYDMWMSTYNFSSNVNLEIIWIDSNQRLFSYNFAVSPDDGNYVTDPILFVGTEAGGLPTWNAQLFNIEGNPFKVKVDENKTADETIIPILDQYSYSSYGIQINYANEQVASNYKDYKDLFTWLITALISTIFILFILLLENTYNFIEQYKVRLALRQLHGYGKLKKYKEYLFSILLSWTIILTLAFIFKLSKFNTILVISLLGFSTESILSLLILVFNENRKILNFIKGGI